jgi:hypothetical protein
MRDPYRVELPGGRPHPRAARRAGARRRGGPVANVARPLRLRPPGGYAGARGMVAGSSAGVFAALLLRNER